MIFMDLSRSGFKTTEENKKMGSQPHRDGVKDAGATQPVWQDPQLSQGRGGWCYPLNIHPLCPSFSVAHPKPPWPSGCWEQSPCWLWLCLKLPWLPGP